jgi:phenylacetate-CoA ligase
VNWEEHHDLERQSPTVIREVQEGLLRKHLDWISKHSPFYSQLFRKEGIDPQSIRNLDDLKRLPVTDKDTLAARNQDFHAIPESESIDLCMTSGTTGEPLVVPLSASDWERLSWNEYQALRATGIGPGDRVLIACSMTRCFMAGLAYFEGLKRIGATAVRAGPDNPHYILDVIRRTQPSAIIGVPSLLIRLAGISRDHGIDPRQHRINRVVVIGEPVRDQDLNPNQQGIALTQLWGAKVYGTYASTEIATSFCECEHTCGGHFRPELAITEILDENNQSVPNGIWGEVTVTPLGVRGLPLLRFKTGDISRILDTPCACGRSTPRLAPIAGRKQQMLKIKGCTLYPNTILSVVAAIPEIHQAYVEASRDEHRADQVKIILSTTSPDLTADVVSGLLAAKLRFRPKVEIHSQEAVAARILDPAKRKPITFFDHRTD